VNTINSVLGPLETSALGFTLGHEHVQTSTSGITQNYPEFLEAGFMERIVTALTNAKEGGIDTVVDATTLDLGRDVSIMAEASRRSGVNIIACTGFYLEPMRLFGDVSSDQFAGLFIREIKEGIAGTGIKPGVLKSASDLTGVTKFGETILRAIARAHLKTDIPIMIHSYAPGQVGKQQLSILREEGVDLRRVKVDHSSDTVDLEYLTWLLDQGCYLGMERLPERLPGRGGPSPLARIKTIKALIDTGYVDRILPAHDWLLVSMRDVTDKAPFRREDRERTNPHGLLWVKKELFPKLREMGVPESTLKRLCVDGPRKFFEGA
jgi:phosphotriesterase-related protein